MRLDSQYIHKSCIYGFRTIYLREQPPLGVRSSFTSSSAVVPRQRAMGKGLLVHRVIGNKKTATDTIGLKTCSRRRGVRTEHAANPNTSFRWQLYCFIALSE